MVLQVPMLSNVAPTVLPVTVLPQATEMALAHKSLASAQVPGAVVTALDSALTILGRFGHKRESLRSSYRR